MSTNGRTDGRTDGRKDGRTDELKSIVPFDLRRGTNSIQYLSEYVEILKVV